MRRFLALLLFCLLATSAAAQPAEFFAETTYAISGDARDVAAVDLDGINGPDLVAASHADDGVSVLLNDGAGDFGAYTLYEVANAISSVAVGDFDGDGDPDVVAASAVQELWFLPGAGDGTLGTPVLSEETTHGGAAVDLVVADFDRDDVLDVAALTARTALLFHGNGDGTFTRTDVVDVQEGSFQYGGLVARDLNGDTYPDLAFGNGEGQLFVALNDMEGNLIAETEIFADISAYDLTSADVDGDGDPDLVATGDGSIRLFTNDGSGAFTAGESAFASGFSIGTSLSAADLNLDGAVDVVVTSGSSGLDSYYGAGDGTFEAGTTISTSLGNHYGLLATDLNGDGKPDLAVSDTGVGENELSVRLNATVPPEPILAADDTYTTDADTRLDVPAPGVLENDSGAEPLTAEKLTNPANGEADVMSDGSLFYIPTPGFSGDDSFTYEVTGADGQTDQATIFITVHPAPEPPPAEPLFLSTGAETGADEAYITRKRAGQVNIAHLATIAAGEGGEVLLNLFDDVELVAYQERVEWRGEAHFTWYGRFYDNEQDHVILVVNLETATVMASITVDADHYRIERGDDGHEVIEVDPSAFPQGDDTADFEDEPVGKNEGPMARVSGMADAQDSHPVIDILVVYTDGAVDRLDEDNVDVEADIQLAIAQTNTSFQASAVTARTRLVGTERISYTGSNDASTDLDRMKRTNDGHMDEIHTLRDEYGADVVGLYVRKVEGGVCGRAFVMKVNDGSYADRAFFVTAAGCATWNYTFTHELGHVMGARHDWFVDDTNNSPFEYNHGHYDIDDRWRTVMSYNTACNCSDEEDGDDPDTCPAAEDRATTGPVCRPILRWSNPIVIYDDQDNEEDGGPTGVGSGDQQADNAQALNNTGATVAAYRDEAALTVFGTIAHRDTGDGIEGVRIEGFPVPVETDEEGDYAVLVPDGWSGLARPVLAPYRFDPPTAIFSNVTADTRQDFTALPPPTISGLITDAHTGAPVVDAPVLGFIYDVETDDSGRYEGEVDFGWSGSIVPITHGYNPDPPSRRYENVHDNLTDHDFVAYPAVQADSEWPLTGMNPARTRSGSAAPVTPDPLWDVDLNDRIPKSPVIGPGGLLYTLSVDSDPDTGPLLHVHDMDGNDVWAREAFDDGSTVGMAVGAGGTAFVTRIDDASPLISGIVAVRTGSDADNWLVGLDGDFPSNAPTIGRTTDLYVGTRDGDVFALDTGDGSKSWSFETEGGYVTEIAVSLGGTIYFGAETARLYAVGTDGQPVWDFETDGNVESAPVVAPDGTLYVGTDAGWLYALTASGTEKWKFSTEDAIEESPAIGPDGTVYVADRDGILYSIDPTGTERWRHDTGGPPRTAPVVARYSTPLMGSLPGASHTETVVYVASHSRLVAVNAGGTFTQSVPGTRRWSYGISGAFQTSMAHSYSNRTLFVSTYEHVYAFGSNTSTSGSGLVQLTSLGTYVDPEVLELRDNIHIIIAFAENGFGGDAILGGLPDDPCTGGPLFIPDCGELLASGFGTTTPLVDVAAGAEIRFGFVEEGTAPAVFEGDLEGLLGTYVSVLEEGKEYSGVLAGTTNPDLLALNPDALSTKMSVFQVPTEAPSGSGTPVYAGHFSTDLPAVEMTLVGAQTYEMDALKYGQFSEVMLLEPGEYIAEVRQLNNNIAGKSEAAGPVLYLPVTVGEGENGIEGILLSGFLNPENNLGGPQLGTVQTDGDGLVEVSALGQKEAARSIVVQLLDATGAETLAEALVHLEASLLEELWLDERHLVPETGETVFDEEKDAVRELEKFIDRGASEAMADRARLAIYHLLVADDVLATALIGEASPGCESRTCERELEKARDAVAGARALLGEERIQQSIRRYAHAWESAYEALVASGVAAKGSATTSETPTDFALEANYPNPFNPVTMIGYTLPEESDVRLEVYDVLGRRVTVLVDGPKAAGRHEVTFETGELAGGVYLYRLTAGERQFSKTMTLLK